MNTKVNYTPVEGTFFVEKQEPTQQQIDSYYKETGQIKSNNKTADSPIHCKKVTIIATSNKETHPVSSSWIMGDVPLIRLNIFGKEFLKTAEKHLYARIN